MATKVFLDTDIGSDIDDAVCLAYLLAQPDCDLVGIATSGMEPVERASLADAICRHAGVETPVFPGVSAPILGSRYWWHHPAKQAAALSRWKHRTDFPRAKAIDFMIETILANPGEITLLVIGPMTNVALMLATEPACAGLLKGLYLMAGEVQENPYRDDATLECNVMLDPFAAAMVYQAKVAVHRTIPCNVTRQVKMPAEQVRERFSGRLLEPVLDYARIWFEERDTLTFHDPLAAACIFEPSLVDYTRTRLDIELASERVRGMMYHAPAEDAPHEIALQVSPERFFEHFFSIVT